MATRFHAVLPCHTDEAMGFKDKDLIIQDLSPIMLWPIFANSICQGRKMNNPIRIEHDL